MIVSSVYNCFFNGDEAIICLMYRVAFSHGDETILYTCFFNSDEAIMSPVFIVKFLISFLLVS